MKPRFAPAISFLCAGTILFAFQLPDASPLLHSQQDLQQTIPPQLTYDIAVTVKNIEVIVRRKDGQWIPGLKPSNFKIYEDGVLKKITNFYEVTRARPAISLENESAQISPGATSSASTPEAVQNRIILFFDNVHLHPMNRNWIIKKLGGFLARNFPNGTTNQAMVVLLDRRLNILQKFTSDTSLVLRAMESIRDRTSDAISRTRTWDDVQQEVIRMASEQTAVGDNTAFQQAVSYARGFIEEEMNQIDFSLRSLQAMGNYLAGLKGRKMLIYACDKLPLNPAQEVFSFIGRLFPSMSAETETLSYNATRFFNQFIASCNAQEISFYSLKAEEFNVSASTADKINWDVRAEGLRPINPGTAAQNDGLEIVSRETGGSVVVATRDAGAALGTIEDDLSYYYSLGYTSDAPADDSYHSINVKVVDVGDDYVLRFRTGYLKSSEEEGIKSRVVARLFLPKIDNPLGARIQPLTAQQSPFGQVKLMFKLLIPIGRLTLQDSGGELTGRIKVTIATMDSKNLWSDPEELLQDIKIPRQDREKAMASFFPYVAELSVKPDRYAISIAIQDLQGQKISYIQHSQDVR